MMMYLGLRILAGALWASAVALLVAGSHAYLLDTRVMFFAWGLLLGIAGATTTICLLIEHMVHREVYRSAGHTAAAVGEAVGIAINGEPPPRPISPRRGT